MNWLLQLTKACSTGIFITKETGCFFDWFEKNWGYFWVEQNYINLAVK